MCEAKKKRLQCAPISHNALLTQQRARKYFPTSQLPSPQTFPLPLGAVLFSVIMAMAYITVIVTLLEIPGYWGPQYPGTVPGTRCFITKCVRRFPSVAVRPLHSQLHSRQYESCQYHYESLKKTRAYFRQPTCQYTCPH